MKSSVMKQRFRAGTAVLVVLMLILSVFPVGIWGNMEVEAALPSDAVAIVPSETGTGKKVFNTSGGNGEENPIVARNTGPSYNNVKYNNTNNYYVGDYTYTSRYLTYKSDFYDYLSDEEVANGRGNITDSTASGFTDPFRTFNQRISGYTLMTDATEKANAEKTIELEIRGTINDWNWLYVWGTDASGTQVLGNWNNQEKNIHSPSKTGLTKIDARNKTLGGTTYYTLILRLDVKTALGKSSASDVPFDSINLINSCGGSSTNRYQLNGLKLGYRYIIYPKGRKKDNTSNLICLIGEKLTTTTGTNSYTYPLYFGCFWQSDSNSDYNTSNVPSNPSYNNFYWPANVSLRNDNSTSNNYKLSASVSGLVNEKLKNNTVADLVTEEELPYFSQSWANENSDVVKSWTDVDFPFYEIRLKKDRSGNSITDDNDENPIYYQFNSRDAASLYLDTDTKKIYEHSTAIMSQAADVGGSTKGFYPFNSEYSQMSKTGTNGSSYTVIGNENNLGFGVKYTIPFVLTEDGKIKGIDTTFEFMGDDDVWVFIDGKLALDMGGAHKDAYGKINFAIGANQGAYLDHTASITDGDGNVRTLSEAAASVSESGPTTLPFSVEDGDYKETASGKVYNTAKVHTLTMFFMERGMWESDCFIRFNFIRQNILNVKNNLVVDNVNDGFVNKTYVAANYDLFDYSLENQIVRTRAEEVSSSGLPYAGGRTLATRKVKELTNTSTGLNPEVADNAKGNSHKGNFIYAAFGTEPENIPEENNYAKNSVLNTYFQRYDDYMVIPDNDTGKRYVTGKTDANGYFDLQYGQKSTFMYQFYSDSLMYLVQQDTLKKLGSRTSSQQIEKKAESQSTRKASDLYTTVWKLYDIDGDTLGEQTTDQANTSGVAVNDQSRTETYTGKADNTFQFQNKAPKENIGVNLTAEYTNTPRVGELQISKKIVNATDGEEDTHDLYADDFTINIEFTEVFGQTYSESGETKSVDMEKDDYKAVVYYVKNSNGQLLDKDGNVIKNGETPVTSISAIPASVTNAARTMGYDDTKKTGTIKIKSNQTVVIPNIPVQTKYTITEKPQDYHENYSIVVKQGETVKNKVESSNEAPAEVEGRITQTSSQILNIVNNKRQLGDLVVKKVVANEGSHNTSLFEFEVTLENNYDTNVTYDDFSFDTFRDKLQAGNTVKDSEDTELNDTDHAITFTYSNSKVVFTTKLKHGEKLTITDVPYGTKYTITEKSASDDCTYNISHVVEYGTVTKEPVVQSLTNNNVNDILQSSTTTDTVTNTRLIELRFHKTFEASEGTSMTADDATVKFKVMRSTDGNIWEDAQDFWNNDVSTRTVKWNDGFTIDSSGKSSLYAGVTGMPVCDSNGNYYYYRVTEYQKGSDTKLLKAGDEWATVGEKKYTVKYDTNQIKLVANDGAVKNLYVTNTQEGVTPPITMPSTGGTPIIYLLPFGIVAITLAGVAVVIYRKKLSGEPLIIKSRGGRYRK